MVQTWLYIPNLSDSSQIVSPRSSAEYREDAFLKQSILTESVSIKAGSAV